MANTKKMSSPVCLIPVIFGKGSQQPELPETRGENDIMSDESKNIDTPKFEISRLINSIEFFFEHVFIIKLDTGYRLVIYNKGQPLFSHIYKTLRGARISFGRYFSNIGWKEGIKIAWSHFYPVDQNWIISKIKGNI